MVTDSKSTAQSIETSELKQSYKLALGAPLSITHTGNAICDLVLQSRQDSEPYVDILYTVIEPGKTNIMHVVSDDHSLAIRYGNSKSSQIKFKLDISFGMKNIKLGDFPSKCSMQVSFPQKCDPIDFYANLQRGSITSDGLEGTLNSFKIDIPDGQVRICGVAANAVSIDGNCASIIASMKNTQEVDIKTDTGKLDLELPGLVESPQRIKLETNAGSILLNASNCSEVDIKTDVGKVEAIAFGADGFGKLLGIQTNVGSIHLTAENWQSYNLRSDVGHLTADISGPYDLVQDVDINTDTGRVDLTASGVHRVNVTSDVGKINADIFGGGPVPRQVNLQSDTSKIFLKAANTENVTVTSDVGSVEVQVNNLDGCEQDIKLKSSTGKVTGTFERFAGHYAMSSDLGKVTALQEVPDEKGRFVTPPSKNGIGMIGSGTSTIDATSKLGKVELTFK